MPCQLLFLLMQLLMTRTNSNQPMLHITTPFNSKCTLVKGSDIPHCFNSEEKKGGGGEFNKYLAPTTGDLYLAQNHVFYIIVCN